MRHTPTLLLILIFCFYSTTIKAQELGNVEAANLNIWLQASSLSATLSDGNTVSTVTATSPTTIDATASGGERPTFQTDAANSINGQPVILFDGSTDELNIANNGFLNVGTATARTYFAVFRTGSDISTRQVVYEEGGGSRGVNIFIEDDSIHLAAWNVVSGDPSPAWGFSYLATPVSTDSTYIVSMIYQGNTSNTGTIKAYANGVNMGTVGNIGVLYEHTGAIAIGSVQNDSYFKDGVSSGSDLHHFGGSFTEFAVWDKVISDVQRIVIENALAVKFGITLANYNVAIADLSISSGFDNDITGIGRLSSSEIYGDSRAGGIRINVPVGMDDGEFMFVGSNGASATATNSSDKPASSVARFSRTWMLTQNDSIISVNIVVDLSEVAPLTASDLRLIVDTDGDGQFLDESPLSSVPIDVGGNNFRFENMNIDEGLEFTVLVISGTVGSIPPLGPAGVLDTSYVRFWYRAVDLDRVISDGSVVTTIASKGGNSIPAEQPGTGLEPIFRNNAGVNMNGMPLFDFNGDRVFNIADNDEINMSVNFPARTYHMVIRTAESFNDYEIIYEEGGGVNGINIYIHDDSLFFGTWAYSSSSWVFQTVSTPIATGSDNVLTFAFYGDQAGTGTAEAYVNGTSIGAIPNIGVIPAHSGDIGIGGMDNDTYVDTGAVSGDGLNFKGLMGEFIYIDTVITEMERILIENYLGSSYGISVANDLYAIDDTSAVFDNDLFGIGQYTDGTRHADTRGTGEVIRLNSPSEMTNGEYLLITHNDSSLSSVEYDLPAGMTNRLRRSWMPYETGEVGTVDLLFYLNDWVDAPDTTELRLIIDSDGDGLFANNDTSTIIPVDQGGNVYLFSGVNLTSGQRFTLGSSGTAITLPIDLLYFDAESIGEEVALKWATANEINNDFFTLERSTDGKMFEAIATVEGAGNSTTLLHYDELDVEPVIGTNYYRLRQTDFDGTTEVSDVVAVDLAAPEMTIDVYPNPVNRNINVSFSLAPEEDISIYLINTAGSQVHAQRLTGRQALHALKLPELPNGLYYCTIELPGERRVIPIYIRQ